LIRCERQPTRLALPLDILSAFDDDPVLGTTALLRFKAFHIVSRSRPKTVSSPGKCDRESLDFTSHTLFRTRCRSVAWLMKMKPLRRATSRTRRVPPPGLSLPRSQSLRTSPSRLSKFSTEGDRGRVSRLTANGSAAVRANRTDGTDGRDETLVTSVSARISSYQLFKTVYPYDWCGRTFG
jgi:hypothetical protein